MRWILMMCLLGQAASADTMSVRFEWQGNGGYKMQGAMSFPAELGGVRRIYETDIACFEIAGYQDDKRVGRWALGMLAPDTTWTLTFDPGKMEFLVYGPEYPMPQAWNMNGNGYNCGEEGFGFNIGSAAQDICVNGELIFDSQVPPPQPFPVQLDPTHQFGQDACRPELLLGAR